MAKVKKAFYCKECGGESPKWFGQCPACGAWGSCSEEVIARVGESGTRRVGESRPQRVADIADADHKRIELSSPEVNRVLGGGLVLLPIMHIASKAQKRQLRIHENSA